MNVLKHIHEDSIWLSKLINLWQFLKRLNSENRSYWSKRHTNEKLLKYWGNIVYVICWLIWNIVEFDSTKINS